MAIKILIVEDELVIAKDIKDTLVADGYEITGVCKSVAQAKESLANTVPDMVLIDINLQGTLAGTEIGKQLLEHDQIPFIYISSYVDKKTVDDVKATRPMGYLVKPFKKAELLISVELALNNHRLRKIDPKRNQEVVDSEAPFKIRKTIKYINEHIQDKLEVTQLADIAGLDVAYYSRMFKKYIGTSPYQFILQRKIERAEALLSTSNYKISEIAYDLGFQSHASFSASFHKINGSTPEDYRKSQRIKNR